MHSFSSCTAVLCACAISFMLMVTLPMPKALAFGEKELLLLNVGIPAIRAAIKAHRTGYPIEKAVLQAAFGGYIMQEGFKLAPKVEKSSAWEAWQAKLMVNFGASLAESAADEFRFRMDIGPVWLETDGDKVRFRPALNAVVAPLIHLKSGAKIDWSNSFKYGTLALSRNKNSNGTLNSSGALAYSQANTFITDPTGAHAGHELVHTFQYRREAMSNFNLSNLSPWFKERLGDGWVDDTNWTISWALQCAWADATGKSKDFDIPMEKEAYYLEHKYYRPY